MSEARMDPYAGISTLRTSQHEQAEPSQVRNNAGGYTFSASEETRVGRFLVLGTVSGSYYVTTTQLTHENAEAIIAVARERGEWLVERILEISESGRAPRQQPAILALAVVAGVGSDAARAAALAALPRVCRTASTLFTFVSYVQNFRGWGRGLRHGVGDWYLGRGINNLAYQVLKYRQREGWTHRDTLRMAHPKPRDHQDGTAATEYDMLFRYLVGNRDFDDVSQLPPLVHAFEEVQTSDDLNRVLDLVSEHRLSWEMIPDRWLTERRLWSQLVAMGMPQGALLRQLPTLTRHGVFELPPLVELVSQQLANSERLHAARIHPAAVLLAMRTYAAGRSMQGENTWAPRRQIVDALDSAFYAAFPGIEPANKRTLVALDVSGSMGVPVLVSGNQRRLNHAPLSAREASAAMAMATIATEPATDVIGFTGAGPAQYIRQPGVSELTISPRRRLDDIVRSISGLPFGRTDCALPMLWAQQMRRAYDTFVIYTDNETWFGNIHPHQALRQYRQQAGIDARLIVVGMSSTAFTIADPHDPGMLDVAGFDANIPNLIADFSRGGLR